MLSLVYAGADFISFLQPGLLPVFSPSWPLGCFTLSAVWRNLPMMNHTDSISAFQNDAANRRPLGIAVGTPIAERPPHKSRRAQFATGLPSWVIDGKTLMRPRMNDSHGRQKCRHESRGTIPRCAILLRRRSARAARDRHDQRSGLKKNWLKKYCCPGLTAGLAQLSSKTPSGSP